MSINLANAMQHASALTSELHYAERQPLPEYHAAYVHSLENAHRQALECAEAIVAELVKLAVREDEP